jgi:hypothetical protein
MLSDDYQCRFDSFVSGAVWNQEASIGGIARGQIAEGLLSFIISFPLSLHQKLGRPR